MDARQGKRLVPKAFGGIGSERIERKIYKPGSGDKTDVTHRGRNGMVATRQSARGDSASAAQADDGNRNLRGSEGV